MGLDSVELIMNIEKHFDVRILNAEAEQLLTVQDVSELVAKHRPLVIDPYDIRSAVRQSLLDAVGMDGTQPSDDQLFLTAFDGLKPKELWSKWASTGLKMPTLPPAGQGASKPSWRDKIFPRWASGRTVDQLTLGQLIDGVVARNHMSLIDPLKPRSRYEILMAVIGISSDSLGIPELEIRATDSYTKDLGVD
jgi:hypothetical protein